MDLQIGSVVQLSPETANPAFAGCFMLVTEPKDWGAQGFVQVPDGGRAYYRALNVHMEYIGQAVFIPEDEQP